MESEAPVYTEERSVPLCSADFEVEITSGPEQGFKQQGKLTFVPTAPHAFTGFLEAEGALIPVVGTQSNAQLALAFSLDDGRTIVGLGPAPAEQCSGRIEGVAVGPSLDASFSVSAEATSTGHWVATEFTLQNLIYELDPVSGSFTPVGEGFTENVTSSETCEIRGADGSVVSRGPAVTCTTNTGTLAERIGDAIANFFGRPTCESLRAACALAQQAALQN